MDSENVFSNLLRDIVSQQLKSCFDGFMDHCSTPIWQQEVLAELGIDSASDDNSARFLTNRLADYLKQLKSKSSTDSNWVAEKIVTDLHAFKDRRYTCVLCQQRIKGFAALYWHVAASHCLALPISCCECDEGLLRFADVAEHFESTGHFAASHLDLCASLSASDAVLRGVVLLLVSICVSASTGQQITLANALDKAANTICPKISSLVASFGPKRSQHSEKIDKTAEPLRASEHVVLLDSECGDPIFLPKAVPSVHIAEGPPHLAPVTSAPPLSAGPSASPSGPACDTHNATASFIHLGGVTVQNPSKCDLESGNALWPRLVLWFEKSRGDSSEKPYAEGDIFRTLIHNYCMDYLKHNADLQCKLDHCYFSSPNKPNALREHVMDHFSQAVPLYQCSSCGESFRTKRNAQSHVQKCGDFAVIRTIVDQHVSALESLLRQSFPPMLEPKNPFPPLDPNWLESTDSADSASEPPAPKKRKPQELSDESYLHCTICDTNIGPHRQAPHVWNHLSDTEPPQRPIYRLRCKHCPREFPFDAQLRTHIREMHASVAKYAIQPIEGADFVDQAELFADEFAKQFEVCFGCKPSADILKKPAPATPTTTASPSRKAAMKKMTKPTSPGVKKRGLHKFHSVDQCLIPAFQKIASTSDFITCKLCRIAVKRVYSSTLHHLRAKHSTVIQVKCPLCEHRFDRKDLLISHGLKNHPDETSDGRVLSGKRMARSSELAVIKAIYYDAYVPATVSAAPPHPPASYIIPKKVVAMSNGGAGATAPPDTLSQFLPVDRVVEAPVSKVLNSVAVKAPSSPAPDDLACRICGKVVEYSSRAEHANSHVDETIISLLVKCICDVDFNRKDPFFQHLREEHQKSERDATLLVEKHMQIFNMRRCFGFSEKLVSDQPGENTEFAEPLCRCALCSTVITPDRTIDVEAAREMHVWKHLRTAYKIRKFQCLVCDEQRDQQAAVKLHIYNTHKIALNECVEDTHFSGPSAHTTQYATMLIKCFPFLQVKIENSELIQAYKCGICETSIDSLFLKMHAQAHLRGTEIYGCTRCDGFKSAEMMGILSHLQDAHSVVAGVIATDYHDHKSEMAQRIFVQCFPMIEKDEANVSPKLSVELKSNCCLCVAGGTPEKKTE